MADNSKFLDAVAAITALDDVSQMVELNHILVAQIKTARAAASRKSAQSLKVGGQARLNLPNHRLGGTLVTVEKINRTRAHVRTATGNLHAVSMSALVAL